MSFNESSKAKKRAALAILILGLASAFSIFISTQITASSLEEEIEKKIAEKFQSPQLPSDESVIRKNLTEEFFNQTTRAVSLDSITIENIVTLEDFIEPSKTSEVVEKIIEENIGSLVPPPVKESEIIIQLAEDKNSVSEYLKQFIRDLGGLVSNFSKKELKEEEAIAKALESNDYLALNEYASYYRSAFDALKTISVPQNLKDFHSKQLFALKAAIMSFENMKSLKEDPLRAMIALKIRSQIQKEVLQSFYELDDIVSAL